MRDLYQRSLFPRSVLKNRPLFRASERSRMGERPHDTAKNPSPLYRLGFYRLPYWIIYPQAIFERTSNFKHIIPMDTRISHHFLALLSCEDCDSSVSRRQIGFLCDAERSSPYSRDLAVVVAPELPRQEIDVEIWYSSPRRGGQLGPRGPTVAAPEQYTSEMAGVANSADYSR